MRAAAGGALSTAAYRDFSLAYMRLVVAGLRREQAGERVPVIVFTKGGGAWLEDIADTGCDAVGLDWTTDLRVARERVGGRCALQGNLDPMALFAPADALCREVDAVLASFGPLRDAAGRWGGHVFNLGHGISQFTPPESVAALVDHVHAASRRYRPAAAA